MENGGCLIVLFKYSVGFRPEVTNMGPFTNDDSSSMAVATWVPLGHREHLVITTYIKRTGYHHVRAMVSAPGRVKSRRRVTSRTAK